MLSLLQNKKMPFTNLLPAGWHILWLWNSALQRIMVKNAAKAFSRGDHREILLNRALGIAHAKGIYITSRLVIYTSFPPLYLS